MKTNAIFELTGEHRVLGIFSVAEPDGSEVLGMAYVEPDGEMESKLRIRHPSGNKEVLTMVPTTDESEDEWVESLRGTYTAMREESPGSHGRFIKVDQERELPLESLLAQAVG